MPQPQTICLVTPTQPTLNPRLVKEADALAESGYRVEVVCCFFQQWAVEADRTLLQTRAWSCSYVGGSPNAGALKYWWTRFRNGMARHLIPVLGMPPWLRRYTICRAFVELERKACSTPADLYIAHNLEALPAVVAAAAKYGKPFGYDAEDFNPGMAQSPPYDGLTDWMEREYLCRCTYLTAASPGIAEAYANRYSLHPPVSILNVFPLSLRSSLSESITSRSVGPLRLYWFSQTIGDGRGIEDVVEAMGSIPGCDIELHIQGQWLAGYRDRLLALARRVGVEESRIHAHPPAHPDRLVEISASYDVGLALEMTAQENRRICLTNKLFVYVLAGNAIAATATTAQAAIMKSWGPAGFLYEPGDIAALANGLRQWHDDRTLLRAARGHSWHLGSSRYNWDVEKQIFLQAVEKVLSSSCRTPSTVA